MSIKRKPRGVPAEQIGRYRIAGNRVVNSGDNQAIESAGTPGVGIAEKLDQDAVSFGIHLVVPEHRCRIGGAGLDEHISGLNDRNILMREGDRIPHECGVGRGASENGGGENEEAVGSEAHGVVE